MKIQELIALRREQKGWSQTELAEKAENGVKQQDVARIEKGQTKTSKHLASILDALDIGPADIAALPGERISSGRKPEPKLLGQRDLRVFASVEGGPGEMMVYSTDPLEIVSRPWYVERDPEAFGVFLAGDSMEPVYEAGEIIIVSPRSPLKKGKEAIFIAEPEGGDFRASLKRYRGQTDKAWLAKQFNPEGDLEFDRGIWRKANRVLGTYDG